MKTLLLIFVTLLLSSSFAQSDDPIFKQLQKMREDMMKQMQDSDHFDSQVQKMFKRMERLGQIQGPPNGFGAGIGNLEYFWKDDTTLIIKVGKEDEVNVDVKDGVVQLNVSKVSKTKTSYSKSTFSQSIQVRPNLDPASVDMKFDKGNIILSFKKKGLSKKNI